MRAAPCRRRVHQRTHGLLTAPPPTLKLEDENISSVTVGNHSRQFAHTLTILSMFYGVAQHPTWLVLKHT